MSVIKGLKTVSVLMILFVSSLLSLIASSESNGPPNVLLIVVDDLRPELNCYGAEGVITPNIDRLASQGMLFENAYAQYPVCNPSRASLLTGLRPNEVGILSNMVPLRSKWPDVVTLPQVFREIGYYTAGLGKIFHLGLNEQKQEVRYVDSQSFDYFYDAKKDATDFEISGDTSLLNDCASNLLRPLLEICHVIELNQVDSFEDNYTDCLALDVLGA